MTCLLLSIFALFLLVIASAEAGRVKGVKGPSAASTGRTLKEKEKDPKKEKLEGIPAKKVKGPSTRSCKSDAKSDKVEIVCGAFGRKAAKATKKGDEVVAKAAEKGEAAPKATKEGAKDGAKEKEKESKGPNTRSVTNTNKDDPGLDEAGSRGINLTPSEQIRDSIKYVVKTNKKGIKVAIEYKQEVENNNSENKTETEFELMFESLMEYVKGPQVQRWGPFGNGVSTDAYNWDSDEIVQVIPLKEWDSIPGIISSPDGVVKYFTASASLTSREVAIGPTGKTHFNFTVSEATLNDQITANSMKIDVRILNFPWQRTDSYIALMSTVKSKKKVHLEYDDEALVSGGKSKLTEDVYITFDEEMQNLGLEAFGAYTWADSAEVTTVDDSAPQGGGTRRTEEEDTPNVVEDLSAKPGVKPVDIQHVEGSITTIMVVATSPEDSEEDHPKESDNHQTIAYSFIGDSAHSAAEIYWDPETGVGYGEAPISAALWSLRSIAWTGAFVGALLASLW